MSAQAKEQHFTEQVETPRIKCQAMYVFSDEKDLKPKSKSQPVI